MQDPSRPPVPGVRSPRPAQGPALEMQPTPLESARRALKEGRLDEAVALAEAALEPGGGPRDAAWGLCVLGEVALRRDKPREALRQLEESFRLAPRSFTASLIVRSLYRAGDWEEGVARARGFLLSFPGDTFLRLHEAHYHLEKGELAKAEEVLQGVLKDDPECSAARGLLIDARTRSSQPDDRVRALEELFRIESRRNDPQLRYLQGRNRMEAGDAAGACREFAAAAALDPENSFFRRHLAFALKRAGLFAEAVRALRELFLEDPSDVYVRSALQGACAESGNREALRGILREALRLHPEKKFLLGMLRKAEKGR